jgi:hypothetical protein
MADRVEWEWTTRHYSARTNTEEKGEQLKTRRARQEYEVIRSIERRHVLDNPLNLDFLCGVSHCSCQIGCVAWNVG